MTANSIVTDYLLDVQPGLEKVIAATTPSATTRYVHGPRGLLVQEDAAGNWEWPVQDGLGSVRGMAANDLSVLESRMYAPYGETFGTTGTPQTAFGFTGEQTDDNNLVYLRARYHNPEIGAFLSLDPVVFDNRKHPHLITENAPTLSNPTKK
jgi:RHS repeat-associated protein